MIASNISPRPQQNKLSDKRNIDTSQNVQIDRCVYIIMELVYVSRFHFYGNLMRKIRTIMADTSWEN